MYIHAALMQSIAAQRSAELRAEFASTRRLDRPVRAALRRRSFPGLPPLHHPRTPEPCPTC